MSPWMVPPRYPTIWRMSIIESSQRSASSSPLVLHAAICRINDYWFLMSACKTVRKCSLTVEKIKSEVITLANKKRTQAIKWTNQNSKQIHAAGIKCRELCVSEWQSVLVVFLVSEENGKCIDDHEMYIAKENKNKSELSLTPNWKRLNDHQFNGVQGK